jgi:flavodoxin
MIGAGAVSAVLTACTGPTVENPPVENTVPDRNRTSSPPSSTTPATGEPAEADRTDRVLVAYFSRPGENYYYGDRIDLQVGNTQRVADLIAASAAVDVYRIEAADPYPHDYEETVARNVREENEDARPAIADPLPDVSDYTTVLLGSPVWNVQTPMIMRTFVEGVDLAGKTIHPFVTYAVSGMGRVAGDYERLCPGSTIGPGLAVQGEEAQSAGADVDLWLREVGLRSA